ncbi:hypothetical protein QJS10_CPB21g01802 [Acorus calamus]|uniref:Programmed cell death protein 2 C-terminal domain-containing protein n=1 Tax=Acorus calamus TaxID=4465 RepID=A0AAV9C3C5_ACOCL|nr:hypothetical protein QJS10_CPB21g01802 [Acorus calamus]
MRRWSVGGNPDASGGGTRVSSRMSMVPKTRRWEEAGMPVRSKRRRLRVSSKMEGEEEKERHHVWYYAVAISSSFVEEPKTPHSLLRHLFPSKAGGTPAWLDPIGLPDEKSRCCGFCENPLQFLLQVYAPIAEKESAFHRTVFVFMCTSMACLLRDQHEQWRRGSERPLRSVKVFRCQLPRLNRFYPSEAPKEDGIGRSLVPGDRKEWLIVYIFLAFYEFALVSQYVMHWRSGHKADCQQAIISSGSSDHIYNNGRQALEGINTEYEIICEDECPDMVDDDGSSTSLVCKDANVNEVYQSLSKSFEVEDDKKRWASFQERVIRAPEQVLRSFGFDSRNL